MANTFKELLEELDACEYAREWAGDMTVEEAVAKCHRGDWLLWLAKAVRVELRPLTLAKALCAKTVLHLMEEERSRNAVEVAERFGRGEATKEELDAAAHAAYVPPAAPYTVAVYVASAAYGAASSAYSAASAYAAMASALVAASASSASSAREANKLQTAEICREVIGDMIIQQTNKKL